MRRAEDWDTCWTSVTKACVEDNKLAKETEKEVSQERFIG